MAANVAVIDYGLGNLHSVRRALEHVASNQRILVTQDPERVMAADRVVFPGQGAIAVCMAELARQGLLDAVREAARSKPFLGICLGPQALLQHSDENRGVVCLGILPGRVIRFPDPLVEPATGEVLKVPHMGWSRVQQAKRHPLWHGIEDGGRFYFVHSYYPAPSNPDTVLGTTVYGLSFASAIGRDNIFAAQFHPEKSARDGLRLLANFAAWAP